MSIQDLWRGRDGRPTRRAGTGKRWRVVVDGHPTKAFVIKADAVEWERRLLALDPALPETTIPVAELVPRWLAGKKGLSPRGLEACEGDARHVLGHWGGYPASEIQTHQVQAWIAQMTVERGPKGERVTKPASEALRRRVLACLRGSLQIAVAAGGLRVNPCDAVTVPRDHKREGRFLTLPELKALAEACGPRYGPLVMLLGTTGLRVGEAVALTVGDVDLERRRIRVRRAKSGQGRDVPVPSKVAAMLPLDDSEGERRGAADRVFRNRGGRPVDVDHFRARTWRQALAACGLEGVRIHDLRHTAASLAIAQGADVKVVQRMLGHATAAMTLDLYAGLFDHRLDEVAEALDGEL